MESEQFLRNDACRETVLRIQPFLEGRPLQRQVVVKHRLAEFGSARVREGEELRRAVHGHGERLAGQVSRTRCGTNCEMAHPYRLAAGTEMETPVDEVPIYWTDERSSVGSHRGEHEEDHALKTFGQFLGTEPMLIREDPTHMRAS